MERNNITEKSILEAAERMFLKKGFAQTTTTMIAREVGCNQSLIHYYYRSKEKLFQLVFEKQMQNFIVGLPNVGNKSLSFEERIKHCVYSQFEMLQVHPEIIFFLMNELSFNPKVQTIVKETIISYTTDIVRFIASELKVEINSGNIRPISPINLIMNIFTLNASIFLLFSISKKISLFTDEELQKMINQSKHSNYTIIIRSIKN